MSVKKKKQEAVVVEQKELPIGIAFHPDKQVFKNVYFADLLKLSDALNSLIMHVKSEGLQENTIKHYFEKDLEDATNEEGQIIYQEDGVTPHKVIKKGFW